MKANINGSTHSAVVAPGSRELADFFDAFAEMPHRGSGTPYEPRSARILARKLASETGAHVDLEPFAVDLSSGTWGVAIHGILLVFGLAIIWCAGLASTFLRGPGALATRLGWMGTVPIPYATAAFLWIMLLLGSRLFADYKSWNIASFFVPNADSFNVIATDMPPLEQDPVKIRLAEQERWRLRFTDAQSAGTSRLVIVMAHYDSARQLPSDKTPRWLLAALKSGIGTLPTIAYCVLAGILFGVLVLGILNLNDYVYSGTFGLVLSVFLLLAVISALSFAAIEGFTAAKSSSLPFVQGMNDDFSGVAAAFQALKTTLAPAVGPGGQTAGSNVNQGNGTRVMTVFTGAEENGLRGSALFAREVLTPAIDVFGAENVELINLDTVSGGTLRLFSREKNFTGATVGGQPEFGRAFWKWATGPIVSRSRAVSILTPSQIQTCLRESGTSFSLNLELSEDPVPACTDLSGIWAGLPSRHRKTLRAFSIVSRVKSTEDPLARPRDYHKQSDSVETLFLDAEPGNFGTVAALAEVIGTYLAMGRKDRNSIT